MTLVNPGASPNRYVIPADVDGPVFAYVTVPLTVAAATAVGGSDTVVVTSAIGDNAVVALALSGSVFGPWLVDVAIEPLIVTDPLPGAVYATPSAMLLPALSVAGIPPNVTAPLAESYVAVAPPGNPVMLTPVSPGGKPSVVTTPAATDGPAFAYVTEALTVVPALALAGAEIVVETSASGEIAVVALDASGCAFAPCEVDVPIPAANVTEPDVGAVYDTPMLIVWPLVRVAGIPASVTAPDAAS